MKRFPSSSKASTRSEIRDGDSIERILNSYSNDNLSNDSNIELNFCC